MGEDVRAASLTVFSTLPARHTFEPVGLSLGSNVPTPTRRGITLQRYDIPMQPSQDFPTAELIELIEAAPEPAPEK